MKINQVLALCMASLLAGAVNGAQAAVNPPGMNATAPGAGPAAAEPSFSMASPYTAQRRPRVAILGFDDTNAGARDTRYGSSVEAMLMTFLKRKSQFVVVERQKLDTLLAEKARLQQGRVQVAADDKESQRLLEKVDVFVLGSVTLLNIPTTLRQAQNTEERKAASVSETDPDEAQSVVADDTGDESEGFDQSEADKKRLERREGIEGPRVEIDAKLISRFDGRIIAAAQRSGPVACLRSIVERLGIALEQEFLRPYYGTLKISLDEPEHIRVFLTPILPEDALDEEKPPVELSTTVTIGADYDVVEPWTTDPTTYIIKNLLSGWYSMRIERPGYDAIGIENLRWEVRKRTGRDIVYDRQVNVPLDQIAPAERRFLVRVDPLTTELVDGKALHFEFRKQGGSVMPIVKRQYVDADYSHRPQRVILMGDKRIELNRLQRPAEYADDERCDLFDERKPLLHNYGRTYVAAGGSFDFNSFTGGELIIEDYQGEEIPVGVYKMVLWEPFYETESTKIRIRVGDQQKPVKTSLTRETAALSLASTGPQPENKVFLEGRETHQLFRYQLDFEKPRDLQGLPADVYQTTTNIAGLDGWQGSAVVPASNLWPPIFNNKSPRDKLETMAESPYKVATTSSAGVKTRFGLGGRLETWSQRPDPESADLFIDDELSTLLNLLLYRQPEEPEEERSDFWQAAVDAKRVLSPAAVAIAADRLSRSSSFLTKAALQGLAEEAQALAVGASGPPVESDRSHVEEPPPAHLSLKNQEVLRKLLAAHLELLDLIVLDPMDLEQLQRFPEVAAILARYIASGGSLFVYISAVGEYRQVLGTPVAVEGLSKRTRRLDLAPGEVKEIIPHFKRRQVRVKARRRLPKLTDLPASWHALAYTRRGRRPRIMERAGTNGGAGYLAVWLDDPQAFRGRRGGKRSKVEEIRTAIEDRVLQQARLQMRRRFDRSQQALQPCNAPAAVP